LANILRYAPTQALNFGLKGQFKRFAPGFYRNILCVVTKTNRIFVNPPNASSTRKFAINILSGGLAGSAALAVVYPLDYARTRLANDSGSKGGRLI
jgi:solute carrier family 25 (adenine nucleotide translocator) protein 4/5/6/31